MHLEKCVILIKTNKNKIKYNKKVGKDEKECIMSDREDILNL